MGDKYTIAKIKELENWIKELTRMQRTKNYQQWQFCETSKKRYQEELDKLISNSNKPEESKL